MAFLRFLDNLTLNVIGDTFFDNATITWNVNETGQLTTQVPLNTPVVQNISQGVLIELWDEGELIFSGSVQSYKEAFNNEKALDLVARDLTDTLMNCKADGQAYFENLPFLAVMGELLRPIGWRVGDVSTMADPTISTTIDLRGEESLGAQIKKLVGQVPRTYYRYAGYINGKPALDVGLLEKATSVSIYNPPDLPDVVDQPGDGVGLVTSFARDVSLTEIIYEIEAVGGDMKDNLGVQRSVHLGDAIDSIPALAQDVSYPIIEQQPGKSYTLIRTDAGYMGGTIKAAMPNTTSFDFPAPAGGNKAFSIRFIPFPGVFSGFTLFFSTTSTNIVNITAACSWKLCAYNAGTPLIPGAVITRGTFVPKVNRLVQVPVVNGPTLAPNTYYHLVIGWDVAQSNPSSYGLKAFATTPKVLGYSSNAAYTDAGAGTWVALTTQCPQVEIYTVPVGVVPGGRVNRSYNEYAPEKTENNATVLAIQTSALSMYRRAVAALVDGTGGKKKYMVAASMGARTALKPGDSIWVDVRYTDTFFEPFTELFRDYTVTVQQYLRVTGYSLKLGDKRDLSFNLVEGNGLTEQENLVELFDLTVDRTPPTGTVFRLFTPALVQTNFPVTNSLPNTTMSDGRAARTVTIPVGSAPSGKGVAYLAGVPYAVSPSGRVELELVTDPNFDTGQGTVVRITIGERNWDYLDTATVTVLVAWI